jgi:hypothetical protein
MPSLSLTEWMEPERYHMRTVARRKLSLTVPGAAP